MSWFVNDTFAGRYPRSTPLSPMTEDSHELSEATSPARLLTPEPDYLLATESPLPTSSSPASKQKSTDQSVIVEEFRIHVKATRCKPSSTSSDCKPGDEIDTHTDTILLKTDMTFDTFKETLTDFIIRFWSAKIGLFALSKPDGIYSLSCRYSDSEYLDILSLPIAMSSHDWPDELLQMKQGVEDGHYVVVDCDFVGPDMPMKIGHRMKNSITSLYEVVAGKIVGRKTDADRMA